MEDKSSVARKFTALSSGWSEKEYSDPVEFMRRRASMVRDWGVQLQPGDRILELGCGDGSLSCFLAGQGFEVTALDISPGMIEEAKKRAAKEAVAVRFEVADAESFEIDEPYDAVVSFMSAFFTYLEDPGNFLLAIAPSVRKKLIVDWNFRSPCTFVEAAQTLRHAGLQQIEWRPWFIPHTTLQASQPRLRGWVEGRPCLSLLLLILKRWHYTISIKGEKVYTRDNLSPQQFNGHGLPVNLVQRSLIKIGQLADSLRGKPRSSEQ